ncbi:MAG: glycosyltransferase [Rhizobiales bacterium]|nr:glycosyltransferase [Hyphomicrobiales bacterium]NRB13162.1 glycosyltransferase [Hyphomicrobiales bacterium]
MTSKNLSPICLFSYNRLDELKQTVEALQKNDLANESELFIFSDGWRIDETKQRVLAVRSFVKTIVGFKKITIIESEINMGLATSIISGVSKVIDEFGSVIVVEDDLITSPNFLTFMNEALIHYKNRQDVFSISGYTGILQALDNYRYDSYLSYRPCSSGWASWQNQWDDIDWSVEDFKTFISDRKKVTKFNRGGIDMARMLRHYFDGKNNSWAIRWSYSMFKKNKYCIYPTVSKVQNIGFGIDATHCKGVDIYQTTLDQTNLSEFKFNDEDKVDPIIAKQFKYRFSYQNKALKTAQYYLKRFFHDKKS